MKICSNGPRESSLKNSFFSGYSASPRHHSKKLFFKLLGTIKAPEGGFYLNDEVRLPLALALSFGIFAEPALREPE